VSAKTLKTSPISDTCPMKPSATRALETATTYSEARAELSLIVCARAP
jgi:hypothetical protein